MSNDADLQEVAKYREDIVKQIESGKLKLPGLPDIAVRVRQVMRNENHSIEDLAKILQADIPLTARLIQVANCPLYKTAMPVEHVHAAISRLGLKVTRNLVTSFTLRRAFSGKGGLTRKLAEQTWKHSLQVGTLAYSLARVSPRLDPEHTMLAALVHDIGILPVLSYAETHPELLADPLLLNVLLTECRVPAGLAVLNLWRFEPEFIDVLQNAENWQYSHEGDANTVDVIIVAQLLAFSLSKPKTELPPIEVLPSHSKFPLFRLGRAAYLELIAEAKDEMAQLTQLLSA
jgi:HD-like signal output (HDOD) protein